LCSFLGFKSGLFFLLKALFYFLLLFFNLFFLRLNLIVFLLILVRSPEHQRYEKREKQEYFDPHY